MTDRQIFTEMVFILDRSGSMEGLEKDTIGGFNSLIKKQKEEPGRAVISTVLFDSEIKVVHDRIPLQDVPVMTSREYCVGGCTALLDAVGGAVSHISRLHKEAGRNERPDKTIFVITTDGMENASREYTYSKVREMIEKQRRQYGWEFIFLGANMDAAKTAGDMGIRADRAATYECDSQGLKVSFKALEKAVSCCRAMMPKMSRASASAGCCAEEVCYEEEAMPADWADDIKKDYARRHR